MFNTWTCTGGPHGLQRKKRWQEVSVSLTQSPFSCYDGSGLGLRQLSFHLRTSCSSTCLIARSDTQTLQGGRLLLTGLCCYKTIMMEGLKIKPMVYNSSPFPTITLIANIEMTNPETVDRLKCNYNNVKWLECWPYHKIFMTL